MTRRKLITGFIALAALYILAPVSGAKADTNDSDYTVTDAYKVSIPAEVSVDAGTKTGALNITGTINPFSNLEITIESNGYLTNSDNTNKKLNYSISNKKLVFSNDTSNNNYNLSYSLGIKVKGTPNVSGTYTDTLTFTMTGENYASNNDKCSLKFHINCDDTSAAVSTTEKALAKNELYGMLPEPTRTGYTFKGWYTSKNPGNDETPVNETTQMGAKDVDLYAKWEINKYRNTMTFWAWGFKNGEGTNGPGTALELATQKETDLVEYGTSFNFTTAMAQGVNVPNGYILKQFGSATVPNTDKWQRYELDKHSFTQPDWSVNAEYEYDLLQYNITYDLDGGTNNSANPKTYTVLYGVTFQNPVKDGYTFEGWYNEATGEKVTGINENCTNDFGGSTNDKKAAKFYEAMKTRKVGDIKLKAQWKKNPISYTVKYNANNGTGVIDNLECTSDTNVTLASDGFTREGYVLAGWNTKADGSGTFYQAGATVQNLTATDGDIVTLYAQWGEAPASTSNETEQSSDISEDNKDENSSANTSSDEENSVNQTPENTNPEGQIDEGSDEEDASTAEIPDLSDPGTEEADVLQESEPVDIESADIEPETESMEK